MTRSLRLPITNIFADGGYSVRAHVGAHQQAVHLILDTGSATLALGHAHYHVEKDNYVDMLSVDITSKLIMDWLINEAHK